MAEAVSPAFAAWHELRHFVGQTALSLVPLPAKVPMRNVLYKFDDHVLRSEGKKGDLYEEVREFVASSCQLVEGLEADGIRWPGGAGPAIDGVGLERLIIARELQRRAGSGEWRQWREDVANILSFFSQTSQRRYEKTSPQLTVAYNPHLPRGQGYAALGKALLDDYKALLRLCRDGHTILVVTRGCTITGIDDNRRFDPTRFLAFPAPPRLAHLQQLTESDQGGPVVFNLNPNASMEIFSNGQLVFRKVNDVWRFLSVGSVLRIVKSELETCGGSELTARNLLSLAIDLADRGEGALLYACQEPTNEVLDTVLVPREGIIRSSTRSPYQELTPRMMFTELVGKRDLSLAGSPYHLLTPLLRDLCSIDGATVFSYSGKLLGFGCLVAFGPSRPSGVTRRREGARSAAAKEVSKTGLAIKVSSDGDAVAYVGGKEVGPVF